MPLLGRFVRLDPLTETDLPELFPVLADPGIYASGYVMHRRPRSVADAVDLARQRFMAGQGQADGAGRGRAAHGRRWWGTQVNAEAKLLLLTHCFEECGYGRVKIQTDALNTRSQAAIARLGARREGVLRRDMKRADGTFRDTVVFSILTGERTEVKAGLQARLRV